MRFTPEQQTAIDRRDGALFLHAGAGSGKTRVLVERFVRAVVDDDVPVERLLAITFTDKAAAEMKARVRRRFLELGEREHAREAERAWVSTIHGFCSRLLRTNALAAGVDPDYRVLDESRSARLAIDAFDGALEDFLRQAGERGERLDLAASYTPDKLERMVRTVHSRLRSQGQTVPRLPKLDPPAQAGERERLERALAACGVEIAGVEGKVVARALEQIERCHDALDRLPAGEFGEPHAFGGYEVKRGNAKALATPAFDELAEAHAAWVALCAAHKAYADQRLLSRLLDRYSARYAQAKAERSALDFEDLELGARDLLKRDPGLRAELRARFTMVMVDEFQDTNRLQNELLDLISDGNLFTVGDEAQSIYGFRNADVEVFRERRDNAVEAGRSERLGTSFRARPEVLGPVDAAFAREWGESYAALVPGREPAGDGTPHVELLVVDAKKARWDDALGEDAFGTWMTSRGATVWRAAEARLLAKRVDELAGPGGRYKPGDVAVLLRAASDMDVYERALADRGLPTYAVGGGGYWSQQQISDLRAYLAALANPRDERSLYTLLASPLVGASLDALALIRVRKGKGKDAWWALEDAFVTGSDADGLARAMSERDRGRIAAFVARFAEERAAAPRMSLETLIDRAVTDSRYDRAVLRLADGARRMANVRKLMRLAREWEAEAGRDLRGFIDYVDEQELLAAREGTAPLEGEGLDAVRLMTIHAAKGLEFPVVCVADLGREGREDHGMLQVSEDGRMGLRLQTLGGAKRTALDMDVIEAEQRDAAEAEERRIFYVAMTRAEEHLVVSGATDCETWPVHEPRKAPMGWVWRALAPGAQELFARAAEGLDADVRCVLCTPATAEEVLPAADRDPTAAPAAAAEVAAAARPSLEPVTVATPLPVARLSYSALESYKRCGYRFYLERVVGMRRAEPPPTPPREAPEPAGDQLALAAAEPEPTAGGGGIDKRVRGTAVHELLERIDLRRPRAPGASEVEEQLQAHGVVASPAAVDEIVAMVAGFLESPTAQRLAAARTVRSELPFAFELDADGPGPGEPLAIDGVLDVYAETGEGALVVDYKTDALNGRSPDAAAEEKYAAQRLVYALAALRAGAERVEVQHLFLERPDEPAHREFHAAGIAELERELLELAAGIVGGKFEPTRRPHRELCQSCPGQPSLCSWPPDRTLADRPEGETFGDPEPVDVRAGVV